jgi:L-histidine Nalpha-methyltransferase
MTGASARVSVRPAARDAAIEGFAAAVRDGLSRTPRQLPTRYLYDSLGSALFEAICRLPWYRITRAEAGLLSRHGTGILGAYGPFARIVELGSGGGGKLATLLATRPAGAAPLRLDLIDVSRAALDAAAQLLRAFDGVDVVGYQADYEAGIGDMVGQGTGRGPALVLLLGSNIGNFDPADAVALMRRIREPLGSGDALLLGADLVKPEADLLLAYDDPLGVTAAFNRNLLVRMNRELGGDFDVASFRHRAVWNPAASRMEMYLVSTRTQQVRVPAAGIDMAIRQGEAIWTENSYKYTVEGVTEMLEQGGFIPRTRWVDEDARFVLTLAEAGGF